MNKKRPVNLDLTSLKFPPMAIASILHRISGVVLFLFLPILLYIFDRSLRSELSFFKLKIDLHHWGYKSLLWGFSVSLIYHVLAGIRHLLMDMGFGEELKIAKVSAYTVIFITMLLSLFLGYWIW